MRIATWNVNGVRARLPYLLKWLAERQPDLVGLQKIRVPDAEFPAQAFESVGYHAVAYCRKGEYGVGILSREKPTVVQGGLPGQDAQGAWLVTAEVDGLELSSVYAPYGAVDVSRPSSPGSRACGSTARQCTSGQPTEYCAATSTSYKRTATIPSGHESRQPCTTPTRNGASSRHCWIRDSSTSSPTGTPMATTDSPIGTMLRTVTR